MQHRLHTKPHLTLATRHSSEGCSFSLEPIFLYLFFFLFLFLTFLSWLWGVLRLICTCTPDCDSAEGSARQSLASGFCTSWFLCRNWNEKRFFHWILCSCVRFGSRVRPLTVHKVWNSKHPAEVCDSWGLFYWSRNTGYANWDWFCIRTHAVDKWRHLAFDGSQSIELNGWIGDSMIQKYWRLQSKLPSRKPFEPRLPRSPHF